MNRPERRGDRRTAPQWTCPSSVERIAERLDDPPVCCGNRAELADGRVYCTICGTVDERSTEDNRREAGRELQRLEERITRDMAGFHRRLEAVEERTVATESQYTATAKHHERMARMFRELGREDDATAAEQAAELAHASARRVQ